MTTKKTVPLDDAIAAALLEANGDKTKAAELLSRQCKGDPHLLMQLALPVMPAIVQAHLNLSIASMRKKTEKKTTAIGTDQISAISSKLGDVVGKTSTPPQGIDSILHPNEQPQASEGHIAVLQQMIQSYKKNQ